MSDAELMEALDGLMAYDTGSTDSGIHDEALRVRVIAEINADRGSHQIFGKRLSRLAREMWLSDEAIESGYGLEDVVEFASWVQDRMLGG